MTTINQFNRYIFASIVITLIIYAISLVLFSNYLDTSEIDGTFLWKVGIIVAVSWLPIFLVKFIRRKISPS